MIPRVLAAVCVTLAALAATAAAQNQPDFQSAAAHYKAAETAMTTGDFNAAALEYGIAFDITKDPILFFKIGQANERAGKCPVALTYYNRYLREGNPSDDYQRLTTERIAVCSAPADAVPVEATPAGGTAVGEPRPDDGAGLESGSGTGLGDAGPSFTDTPSTWKRKTAWVATGLTVGLVAAGVVMAMSAEGSEDDLRSLIDFRNAGRPVRFDEVAAQYTSLESDGKRFDKLATIAFAGAGVTAVVAVTMFILDRGGSERPAQTARITPTVGRHGGGVAVGWEF